MWQHRSGWPYSTALHAAKAAALAGSGWSAGVAAGACCATVRSCCAGAHGRAHGGACSAVRFPPCAPKAHGYRALSAVRSIFSAEVGVGPGPGGPPGICRAQQEARANPKHGTFGFHFSWSRGHARQNLWPYMRRVVTHSGGPKSPLRRTEARGASTKSMAATCQGEHFLAVRALALMASKSALVPKTTT
jgi:hypothetical protein